MAPHSATTVCCHSDSLGRTEQITSRLLRAKQCEGSCLWNLVRHGCFCPSIYPDCVCDGLHVTCDFSSQKQSNDKPGKSFSHGSFVAL